MGSAILGVIVIGAILLVASSPTLQLKIAAFFARKQGEAIQRGIVSSITGKPLLFSEAAEPVAVGAVQTSESFQKGITSLCGKPVVFSELF